MSVNESTPARGINSQVDSLAGSLMGQEGMLQSCRAVLQPMWTRLWVQNRAPFCSSHDAASTLGPSWGACVLRGQCARGCLSQWHCTAMLMVRVPERGYCGWTGTLVAGHISTLHLTRIGCFIWRQKCVITLFFPINMFSYLQSRYSLFILLRYTAFIFIINLKERAEVRYLTYGA